MTSHTVLNNSAWALGYRGLRLGIGFVLGAWLARHLGPIQFGMLGYGIATVAMFNTVASFGMRDVVVKMVAQDPSRIGAIVGTALSIRAVTGLICFGLLYLTLNRFHSDQPEIILITSIIGTTILFGIQEVVISWLVANNKMRYTAWVDGGSFLLIIVPRIYLLLHEYSVFYFACLLALELLTTLSVYLIVFARSSDFRDIKVDLSLVKVIVSESWPLMGAALAITVYMKVDILMLANMADANSVGMYTVAARISEVFFLVPTIVCMIFLPKLATHKPNSSELDSSTQKLLDYFLIPSVAIAIVISISSGVLINLVFGSSYQEASLVLAIHIWSFPLVAMGVIGGKWCTLNGLQNLTLLRTVCAAVINILMNYVLIPVYGGVGAAIATVVAHLLADYAMDAVSSSCRPLFRMKTKSMLVTTLRS